MQLRTLFAGSSPRCPRSALAATCVGGSYDLSAKQSGCPQLGVNAGACLMSPREAWSLRVGFRCDV